MYLGFVLFSYFFTNAHTQTETSFDWLFSPYLFIKKIFVLFFRTRKPTKTTRHDDNDVDNEQQTKEKNKNKTTT